MWSAILLVFEIVKMVISLIIAGLKLWWGAMCWCFAFLVTAFEELKTLKWENQNDKSKIVKNVSIIVVIKDEYNRFRHVFQLCVCYHGWKDPLSVEERIPHVRPENIS